jgi:PAS domain S-box-containing protein
VENKLDKNLDAPNAVEALKQSEERYRLLFSEMVEGFALHEIVVDDQGKPIDYIFLDINPAFEKLTGMKKDHVVGKRIREVLPNIESYWIEIYGKVALTRQDVLFENFSEDLGKWYQVHAFSPKSGQFAATFVDITKRKIVEEALRESERRFRQMFSDHDAAMMLISPEDGQIVDVNQGASRFYGYSIEELRSMKINQINQHSDEEVRKAINEATNQLRNYFIFPHKLASGEIRNVEIYSTSIRIEKRPILFSIIHDVTDRIKAEKKLQEQLEELQRWHDITLGREERILELKKEVNKILKENGLPIKYGSTED